MFSNVGANALMRWYFLLSQVLVVMIHISSDTGLKVIFVLSVVIISNPQIDFAPLPDEVNSSIAVSLMLTCACVCVCVCVCVCARVYTSIYREGLICLYQLERQGTGHRCCVEDVSFHCQVPSSLL